MNANRHGNLPASRTTLAALALLILAASGCTPGSDSAGKHAEASSGAHEHGEHGDEHGDEAPRGSHGGRLLEDAGFSIELTIFEDGVPPEFRLYARSGDKPVAPAEVQATVELHRVTGLPGGKVETHAFAAREDYLVSAAEVYEPHSFDVVVRATHGGKAHEWKYESAEGRAELAPATAASAGIITKPARAGAISDQLKLYGRIVADAERLRSVTARFPGPVRSVAVRVGDSVTAGQALASIESNESLQTYTVTAPIAGTVIARNVNAGEEAGREPLFEIADYGSVWAELAVFPRDRSRLSAGQQVSVIAADSTQRGSGTLRNFAPPAAGSAALGARVALDNRERQWTPGQFVEGEVSIAQRKVALVVPLSALQRFRDWDVVFVQDGEFFQAIPLELGSRDSENVEVLSGLAAGAQVVTVNSYLVKADIEKSGASHDH